MTTTDLSSRDPLPALGRVLRAYMKSGLRGQTRVTFALARRFRSLQTVPIAIAHSAPLVVDLRQETAHHLLKGSPWGVDPFDTAERTVMRRIVKSGDVAFDVGANIGLTATMLLHLVGESGKLYVFEPNPDLTATLRASVERNGTGRCFPWALSDETRDTTLYVPEYNLMASLADWTKPSHGAGAVRGVRCRMQRLDELIERGEVARPDFMKVDVEGAERMVFRGAREVLDRADAPIVLFEVNQRAAEGFNLGRGDAMEFLMALPHPRFRFWQIQSDATLTEITLTDLPTFTNVLAVPASRTERIAPFV